MDQLLLASRSSIATFASEGSSKENFADCHVDLWVWGAFLAVVVVLLVADLILVHKTAHVISTKEAAIESAIWISIGLAFTFVSWAAWGGRAAGEYLSEIARTP